MALQHGNDGCDAFFQHYYLCYPVSSINRSNLENGDKIVMPLSALDKLAYLNIEFPMLFELSNTSDERVTHCGVLEFTAEEGFIYIPNWMMENMRLQEGNLVNVKSANLAKGNFVKLQPHTKDFLDISNPKAVLETALRSYSCLTTGDTVMIAYNNKKYYIDVLETKPSPAVSIIETDCEVDFAPPLDYQEPEKQLAPAALDREVREDGDVPRATEEARVIPFSGSARRLNGKPSTQSVEQTPPPSILKQQQQSANAATKSSNRASGKLVFGSNANTPKTQTQSKASLVSTNQESIQKGEETKFHAFTGKKYSF